MRRISILLCFIAFNLNAHCQLQINKISGGSVVTKLGMGVKLNEGSTLTREFIVINDPNCPLSLADVGINTGYGNSYSFFAVGTINPKEPISAYEIHHVLYNVFGEHIKTLSNQYVSDLSTSSPLSKYANWYANENNVSEYLICVSYVANIRTTKGTIWHFDYKAIQSELNNLKIKYDEEYVPPRIIDKEKSK